MKSIPLFVVHGCLVMILSGCHREPPTVSVESLPLAQVREQALLVEKHWLTEDVTGTVRAQTRAVIEAQVSGRILRMPTRLGQEVQDGEVLLQLEAPEIQARLDQAQARLNQVEQEHERYQRLLEEEAVTRQEYEMVLGRYRVAEASLREAQTMFAYTEIRAPFAGVITRKHADQGDLASPGRPLIELEGLDTFEFEADLPEVLLKNIQVGDPLNVTVGSLQKVFEGSVSEIAPAAESSSRTFPIKLNLPRVEGMRAGQFGRVAIPLKEVELLLLPGRALVRKGQLEMVYVVNRSGDSLRAEMRLIKTGKSRDGLWEVLSGLRAGETVVVEGAQPLRDGQPLELMP